MGNTPRGKKSLETGAIYPQSTFLGDIELLTQLTPHGAEVLPLLDELLGSFAIDRENVGVDNPFALDASKLVLNQLVKLRQSHGPDSTYPSTAPPSGTQKTTYGR